LRPGSGLGLGFGAFFTSFLPLSLLPMGHSMTQKACSGKDQSLNSPIDSSASALDLQLVSRSIPF
jgi:hypothetical protein